MTIQKNKQGAALTYQLTGRLDTTTAPDLDAALGADLAGVTSLVIDLTDVEYLSSAGLRSLLAAQKKMNAADGKMVVRGANDSIKEVFDITGFSDMLTIE